ncbi:MAG: UxaA family hydrolase [SAR324 cluster bacterium]|nr:UxaA family hydrolase [SAR324 cluster bacterium]
MSENLPFDQAGRLPVPGDNVAIAVRRLEGGTRITRQGAEFVLSHTVLEGHRFAVLPIAPGEPLLSWGLTFGEAVRPLAPGDYLCNARILAALRQRKVDFPLPEEENFSDYLVRYQLNEAEFRPGSQVAREEDGLTFMGFERGASRGVGTRNHLLVLGTSSHTASLVRILAERLHEQAEPSGGFDGVVAMAHTEGGGEEQPNNLDFILRTLAGAIVHPNVGAVLAVDDGAEAVNNARLREFMTAQGYPLEHVTHRFISMDKGFAGTLAEGERIARGWLEELRAMTRTPWPLTHLKLALQCGGSDAFSGISGNPLAGWVAKEVIRRGGSANLAETDELIGAERYVLDNVRDLETARAFLEKIDIFKERAGWHGQSVEGNPSGGNNFRGLYNIALKSIGAARKRDPEVRLDHVIDYAQPMTEPGYYFMDSPGNDLESIAGQVASGANMILFITGNGSITNFPFVPTIKIMTTSSRYELLSRDMDINAGQYQDGMAMETLGKEGFAYTLEVASGRRSVGEKAGHSQVSIWRDWRQTDGSRLEALRAAAAPVGTPLPVLEGEAAPVSFKAIPTAQGYASDQVGLIVPSSLCSGQIARMIADKLNAHGREKGISRYVALVHTEGCGAAGGDSEQLFLRTMLGHLRNPLVKKALLLEHGCEKTVNDYIRNYMESQGIDPARFGWASVQLDGGIDNVVAKVAEWFGTELAGGVEPPREEVGAEQLRVGLTANGAAPENLARALASAARAIVSGGGMVVIPQCAPLLAQQEFQAGLLASPPPTPSLAYGELATASGLQIMETPTTHPVEVLTGLGATGVELMLANIAGRPLQAHPMIPLIQVSGQPDTTERWGNDLDASVDAAEDVEQLAGRLLRLLSAVASRETLPKLYAQGNTEFQLTRGWLGISM